MICYHKQYRSTRFYQSDKLRNCIKYVACYGRAVLYYIDIQLDSLRALPQHIND